MFNPFAGLTTDVSPVDHAADDEVGVATRHPFLWAFQLYVNDIVVYEEDEENNTEGQNPTPRETDRGILTRPTPSVVKCRSIPHRQRDMLDTLCVCVGHLNQLLTYRLSVGLDMCLGVRSDLDTNLMRSTASLLLAKLHTVYTHIHRRSITPEVSAVLYWFELAKKEETSLNAEEAMDEIIQRVMQKLESAVQPRKALKRGASNVGVYLSNAQLLSGCVTCHSVSGDDVPIKDHPPPDMIMGSVIIHGRNRHRCRMGKPYSKQESAVLFVDQTPGPIRSPIQDPLLASGSDGVIDWDPRGASHISIDRFRHLLPSNSQTVIVGGASWQRNRARVCKKSVELYLPCFALLASLPNRSLLSERLLALRLLSVIIASVLMLSHSFVPNRQYRLERMLEPLLETIAYI
jgi:hypothetical protein